MYKAEAFLGAWHPEVGKRVEGRPWVRAPLAVVQLRLQHASTKPSPVDD